MCSAINIMYIVSGASIRLLEKDAQENLKMLMSLRF